ncbi:MAG: ribosome small subunit-dependent GTPase, partial [Bacillota bacterium]
MNQTNLVRVFIDPKRKEEANAYGTYELALVIEQQRDLYRIVVNEKECMAKVSGKMMYQALTPKAFPSVGDWVMVENINDIA